MSNGTAIGEDPSLIFVSSDSHSNGVFLFKSWRRYAPLCTNPSIGPWKYPPEPSKAFRSVLCDGNGHPNPCVTARALDLIPFDLESFDQMVLAVKVFVFPSSLAISI